MTKQSMRIQGRDFTYNQTMISPNDCVLDPKNPRVQTLVGVVNGTPTDEELAGLIWKKDQVKALKESIYQNAGVREPLFVQRHDGDKYLVREGNCRTVAARHLIDQYPGDSRFSMIPAWVFDDELGEEDLAVILADMHVAGKIQWPVYEQAKHVYDLHQKYGKPYDWLSIHLRLSKSKIVQLLDAYEAMRAFIDSHPDQGIRKFSFFAELMKKAVLRKRYKGSGEFKGLFDSWVATGRLTDSKEVRNLLDVLGNEEAVKALNDKGFKAAREVLYSADPSLSSDLYAAVKTATARLHATSADEINQLKSGKSPQKVIMVRELHRSLQDLATLAGIDL